MGGETDSSVEKRETEALVNIGQSAWNTLRQRGEGGKAGERASSDLRYKIDRMHHSSFINLCEVATAAFWHNCIPDTYYGQ